MFDSESVDYYEPWESPQDKARRLKAIEQKQRWARMRQNNIAASPTVNEAAIMFEQHLDHISEHGGLP